jgi:hypothetical protein
MRVTMLKRLRTRFAIRRLRKAVLAAAKARGPTLRVTSFGAYWIHPRHLAVWIEVESDAQRDALLNDPAFMAGLCELPAQINYPPEGREGVGFDVASKETVDRDYGGNWWHFYK